jgi:predicted DNA-binding transcriptional regulator AlpA
MSEQFLNIEQASQFAGVSIPTIREKLKRGYLPNAFGVTASGERVTWQAMSDKNTGRVLWSIPETDLLKIRKPETAKGLPQEPLSLEQKQQVAELEAEAEKLRGQVAELEKLRADLELERREKSELLTAQKKLERDLKKQTETEAEAEQAKRALETEAEILRARLEAETRRADFAETLLSDEKQAHGEARQVSALITSIAKQLETREAQQASAEIRDQREKRSKWFSR